MFHYDSEKVVDTVDTVAKGGGGKAEDKPVHLADLKVSTAIVDRKI